MVDACTHWPRREDVEQDPDNVLLVLYSVIFILKILIKLGCLLSVHRMCAVILLCCILVAVRLP